MTREEKKEYHKKYQREHKEQIKQNKKKYYQRHVKNIAEKSKKYRQEHKLEKSKRDKKYREENKEYYKEYKRKYYQGHKEKHKKYKQQYYKKNKKRISESVKKYRQEHTKEARENNIRNNYGINGKQYDEIFKKQNGKCAICLKLEQVKHKSGTLSQLSIDHDHKTGKTRGLLCRRCNTALGLLQDDLLLLKQAVKYLESFIN